MGIYKIGRGISKRLHRYFVYKVTQSYEKRVIRDKNKLLKSKPLTKSQKKEIHEYYSSFGFPNISTDWHRYYTSLTGNFHKEYIPEDFFYNVIEPSLNPRMMFPALTDKNLMESIFSKYRQPKSIVKNVNGVFTSSNSGILGLNEVIEILQKKGRFIIKPSIDSGGGRNVNLIEIKGGKTNFKGYDLKQLLNFYNRDFIVQERLEQHPAMQELNESSINTMRIKTLTAGNEIKVLRGVVRIGKEGSVTDNMNSGGYIARIGSEGRLGPVGYYNKAGHKTFKTYNGIPLSEIVIPNYQEASIFVKKLHSEVLHFGMISWDISIDKEGNPVLVEYNTFGQGAGQEYGPLFNDHTDYVLSKSKLKLFSY